MVYSYVDLFERFVREHRILVSQPSSSSPDDDDDDMIPQDLDALDQGRQRLVDCYMPMLQRIQNREFFDYSSNQFIIEVPLDELSKWNAVQGQELADHAQQNTLRYQRLFASVMDEILQRLPRSNNVQRGAAASNPLRDTVDILYEQRMAVLERQRQQQNNNQLPGGIENNNNNGLEEEIQNANQMQATEDFPPLLNRRYELRILPQGRKGTFFPFDQQITDHSSKNKQIVAKSLRQIRAPQMGQLVTITGMIVKASDVKPLVQVATYSCDRCGAEVYQPVESQREFMPQRFCPSNVCQRGAARKMDTLFLQTRGSKFCKFQELKLQELPNQVPMGHIPRSITIVCRGELTRQATPGDVVTIDGVFLPQRVAESGYRALKAGLVSTTYIETQHLFVHKMSFDSINEGLSELEALELESEIRQVANSPDPVGKLASSIAPEIFGHEDIKRALLLQLVGGCTRKLPDGMRIRGDINICLMGDPGVAKSQLLKHVSSIAPRGVYTTGKGSSGVGLTAAVTKDLTTQEMSLEGGALVLADRGICCIDEFDKMDESDRTAIHEVMEQQTVSIAKAGIVATLNARAAVLAAANPLYGRYNRNKSLSENINLPNSLLSRFDLLFLILDTADVDRDIALARHVTLVHKTEGNVGEEETAMSEVTKADIVSPRTLREYIARARQHQPVMPPEVSPYVVEAYVNLRSQENTGKRRGRKQNDQTAMTPRQLLSILRLSQALARLRFSDFVAREDVDEAIRLTHMSKASLEDDQVNGTGKRKEDYKSRIFSVIKDYSISSDSSTLEIKTVEAMALRKGFTSQQLQSTLTDYEELGLLTTNEAKTQITML